MKTRRQRLYQAIGSKGIGQVFRTFGGIDPLRRAFTLLEIMVAMFLFGMVISAIYSCWYAIARGSTTAKQAAADVQRARMATRTIEDALSSVQSFGSDIQYYGFTAESGDEASLSFVSRLSASFPRSGKFGDFTTRRVTFSVEPGEDSEKQLVLRQNPILMDWTIDEKEHPVVLAKHVHKFALAFWDVRNQDWMDDWLQTNQLPLLVKITLQLDGANPQAPPQEEVTKVVNLPSVTVQAMWQTPIIQGGIPFRPPGLPGPPGNPNPPGGVPPGQPPGGQIRIPRSSSP